MGMKVLQQNTPILPEPSRSRRNQADKFGWLRQSRLPRYRVPKTDGIEPTAEVRTASGRPVPAFRDATVVDALVGD